MGQFYRYLSELRWGLCLIFIIFLGAFTVYPDLEQVQALSPDLQKPDLSDAILQVEDLPEGFVPLSSSDLSRMESALDIWRGSLKGESEIEMVNVTGFRNGSQIVISGLATPLSALEQSAIDREFSNPETLIAQLQEGLGSSETAELPGHKGIGISSIGFTTSMMSFRMEYVVARRGPVLVEIANLYPDETSPIANTIELARLLDDRVANVVGRESVRSFRPAGPFIPELTTAIPTPLDISTHPSVIGTNLLLAALLMLPFSVACELLTRTLGEQEADLRKKIRPVDWLGRLQKRLEGFIGTKFDKRPTLLGVVKLILVMLFYGLVFSLLDRNWNPFSIKGLILFVSMVFAYGLVGIADDIFQWRAIRKWGLFADLTIRPTNLLLAIASTGVSRTLSMVPGLMFGTPEALQTDDKQFDDTKRNELLKISAKTLAFLAIAVWLPTVLTEILQRFPLPDNALNLIGGLEGFLLVIFAVTLENLFVQLLGFSDGLGVKLRRKSKWLWLTALSMVTFLFYHTLINPRGELAQAIQEANVWLFFGIAIAFMVFAFGMYFSQVRHRRTVEPTEKSEHPSSHATIPAHTVPSQLENIQPGPSFISISDPKKCPVCQNTIKAEARVCRFCRATFKIKIRGYCPKEHAVVEANAEAKCLQCGDKLLDVHVESRLLKSPSALPVSILPAALHLETSIETKTCPACGQIIRIDTKVCRFCHAHFEVKILGYCINDHAVVEVKDCKCILCSGELQDIHVESNLIEQGLISATTPIDIQEKSHPIIDAGKNGKDLK